MSRWVVVDDTDPGLTYIGPWFQDNGTLNSLGNYGPPHLNTLHGINSNGSFSYSFNGSIVRITGTNQWNNPTGVINPSWQCAIDGVIFPSTVLNPTTPENRLLYCEKDGLLDGLHVITVNATVSNQTFWFDYIQYLPTSSASLDQASFFVEAGVPQFQYGPGWDTLFPGNVTAETGATFNFEFNGTFLTWLGFFYNALPTASTTATYSIDGQSPVTFAVIGPADADAVVQYNQVVFSTDQLSPGLHNLSVVYQGNSQTAHLTLYELFLENNASSTSSSSSMTSTSSSTSTSTSSLGTGNHSSDVGPIVGGVLGGLAFIVFAVLAIFFLRRRNSSSPKESPNEVNPFLGPSTATLSSLPVTHDTSNIIHSDPQNRAVSPLRSLSPNRAFSPTGISEVGTTTILSPSGLREQRKGGVVINRTPQSQPEASLAATPLPPSSTTGRGNSPQPMRLVHDEDAGSIPVTQTDQNGEVVGLLPPVYSF